MLQIKTSLSVLPSIIANIKTLGFEYNLKDNHEIYELIDKAIYEDPPVTLKDGYLIKTGYRC